MSLKIQKKTSLEEDCCTYLVDFVGNEATFKETHERYRVIAENAMDMISIIDPDSFAYRFVSPSYMKLLGYEAYDLLERCCFDFVHPDDRAEALQILLKGIEKGAGITQYRMLRKDNTEIWVETNGKLMNDVDRDKGILFITRDISSRKQVEEALFDKVNYLNTLLNNMNELCYTIDRNCQITFANQKTIDTTGYSLEEGLGRSILDFIPASEQTALRQEIMSHLESGATSCHEHRFKCKNGKDLLIREKSSAIIENGEIIGILALAEDITEQRRIEKEMFRIGQMHMVGEMAASIAHEIRNPMTTVQGFLQIMTQKEQLQEYKSYFELMIEELNRANSIITEFLSLAKNKSINLQKQNLNKVIENITPLLNADATEGDKLIRCELGATADLLLDEKEIRQLIYNLVRNGLEAMSAGGTIIIKTAQEAEEVVLLVRDEGGGIAPEIQAQLGTPFITSKDNGTGLGMAVCYSIVDRHHARMDYESSPAGTTFRVKFPSLL